VSRPTPRLLNLFSDSYPLHCMFILSSSYRLAGSAEKNLSSEQIVQVKSNFYTDEKATNILKLYVKAITQRQNFYNARIYSEDPTILGW
jgi:hypothetical protein